MIEIQDLHVHYGTCVAVNGLTLSVPQGCLFGLLGPNGAGKTTTLSCLAGLQRPTRGRITIAGIDVIARPEAIKPLLGLVPQSLALFPTLSVMENLRVFGGLYKLRRARLRQRIDWALALAQLEHKTKVPVQNLSGGMQRRLNLACALLHDPQLIICDEPTTGVDPHSRNHLFETIRQLHAEGRTVIYTTHYMEEVESLCERVAIVDQGQVVVDDTLERLLGARQQTSSHVTLQLAGDVDVAALHQHLVKGGFAIEHIDHTRRSLEDVFLNLTGHALRDSA